MTLVPITNNTGSTEIVVRAKPARPPVALESLEIQTGGVMIMGRYAPHEYCAGCVEPILHWNPETKHRPISVYEVLTAYREYRCSTCNRLIWDTNRKDDA